MTSLRGQECKKLKNGIYKINFKTKGYEDYKLRVDNDEFIKTTTNGKQIKGKITRNSDCILVLNSDDQKTKSDTLTFLEQIHRGWGEPCFKLTTNGTGNFRMTWTGNLHVTSSEGRIIRRRK